VTHLSDKDIGAIAQWIGQTESPHPQATIGGDLAAGKSLYQGCAGCHNGDASGNETLGAPSLRGLNDWYLLTQINHFRLGIRGSESGDVYGQQMQVASSLVTTEIDAADLAAYISQLN
jgi:cytochrome c553